MTYDQYIIETQALSFLQKGPNAFGVYRGFPVCCSFQGKAEGKTAVITVSVEGKRGMKFFRALNQSIKGLGNAVNGQASGSVVQIHLQIRNGFGGPFREVMERFASTAEEYGLRPPTLCPICHQGGCNGYAFLGDGYMPVHEGCLRELHQRVNASAHQNMSEGSILTGIIGGLVGGLVAGVPSLLTILLLERVYAALMWLIPMGVAFGYKKCNGKRSRAAGPILILLSLLSMYLMEYMLFVVIMAAEYGWGVGEALITTLPFLLDPSFWVTLVQSSVMELVFLVLGIAVSWKTLTGTAADDVSNVEACLSTYQPMPGAASQTSSGQDGNTMDGNAAAAAEEQ